MNSLLIAVSNAAKCVSTCQNWRAATTRDTALWLITWLYAARGWSYAAEFGIVGPAGRQNVTALIKRVLEDDSLPEMARDLFRLQAEEYAASKLA
jgi:hypothetical protein